MRTQFPHPLKNPHAIQIIGRRWFRRSVGSTYHSAEIYLDGIQVEGVKYAYGYGDQYLYSAIYKLEKDNLITPLLRGNGGHEAPWKWAERNNVMLTYSATDVSRKKDL